MPDMRLRERLVSSTERLRERPSSSNPQALVTESEREGFYRFLRNERVELDGMDREQWTEKWLVQAAA